MSLKRPRLIVYHRQTTYGEMQRRHLLDSFCSLSQSSKEQLQKALNSG